ncbi:MAG: hypothetical protein ACOCRX_06225 [Candidatus Woesearchaeota archaeon]
MNEEDTLLYSYLNLFLEKDNSQIELLVGNNSCTEFESETKKVEGEIKNLDFLLNFCSNKKSFPDVILNFGNKELTSEWVKKFLNYEGNKKVIAKNQDFNFSKFSKIEFNLINNWGKEKVYFGDNIKNIINLDFNQDIQKFKDFFVKAYNNKGEIKLTERKKIDYTEEEFIRINQFIYFLVEYIYQDVEQNEKKYKKLINKNNGFNFFPGFNKGCPANHKIFISLEDLSFAFCPNLTSKEYSYGKIKKDKKVKSKNVELFISILKANLKDMPICETCILNEFCEFDCFLSQQKKSGDFFVPHPEFCRYSHKKLLSFLEAQQKFGLNSSRENKILNKLDID